MFTNEILTAHDYKTTELEKPQFSFFWMSGRNKDKNKSEDKPKKRRRKKKKNRIKDRPRLVDIRGRTHTM